MSLGELASFAVDDTKVCAVQREAAADYFRSAISV
jgi:hypothetical protein